MRGILFSNTNTNTKIKISLLLAIVPIVLISLNKISVDNAYKYKANWHRIINKPVEQTLTPLLGAEHFIKRNYHETPDYRFSVFFWMGIVYLIPVIAQLQLMVWAKGLLRDIVIANTVILAWFFIEFILIFNMVSSIPKIIAWVLIVLSLRAYRYAT